MGKKFEVTFDGNLEEPGAIFTISATIKVDAETDVEAEDIASRRLFVSKFEWEHVRTTEMCGKEGHDHDLPCSLECPSCLKEKSEDAFVCDECRKH